MNHECVIRTLEANRRKHLAYVWSIVRNHSTAEDLCQDLSVAAIQQVESFEDQTHLLKWSRAVLRNKALEYLRKSNRTPIPFDDQILESLDSRWSKAGTNHSETAAASLRECLQELTPGARKLIKLRYGLGMKGVDVARELNRTVHSVYVALSRAYKVLGDCVRRRLAGESTHA